MSNKYKKYHGNWLVLAFFALASLIFTYPLVRCVGTCVRDLADPLLNAWILAWDVRQMFSDPANIFHTNMFYPHANTLAYSESQFSNALLALPVLLLTRQPVLAHNFVYLVSFVLSGFGTFLLVKHFTGNWLAGLVAGMIFAFTPYRLSQFQIQVLATQWMPFALLYLDKAFRRQKWSDFVLFALFFNLTVLASYYYGLFFSVGVLVLGIAYILILRRELWQVQFWVKVVVIGMITAVINIPLALPYFSLSEAGFTRDTAVIELLKLKPIDLTFASPNNWLYGSWAVARHREHAQHAFPGIIAIVLAITGLLGTRNKKSETQAEEKLVANRAVAWAYMAVFLVIVILALGPTLHIPSTSVSIPMPFSLLYNYVPGFQGLRATSRFVIVALLALAVLSGFGLAWLQIWWGTWSKARVSHPMIGYIAVCLGMGLIALEYLSIPIPFNKIPATVPPVYAWLAVQEENSPIIELPFGDRAGVFESLEGLRLYYSTFHWRPLVNGYSGFMPPGHDQVMADVYRFPDRNSISRLNELGVRYVVYHHDLLNEESQAKFDANMQEFSQNLTPVAEFPNTTVYEVQAQGGSGVRQLIADATFGEKLKLVGFGVDQTSLTPGETITVSLLWRGLMEMTEDYTVFLHMVDENGRLLTQQDLRLEPSTSSWQPKQLGRTQHILTIPPEIKTTSVNLIVGVYQWPSLNRLPLLDKNKIPIEDTINLMSIPLEASAGTLVP